MPKFVLHPQTTQSLARFVAHPAQSVIIDGPAGIGKDSIVTMLCARLLHIEQDMVAESPAIRIVDAHDGIDAVRSLQEFTLLRVAGTLAIRRIAVITSAEAFSTEAQNAMLKMLEEPSTHTMFIIVTTQQFALLPTIRSRCGFIHVLPPPSTDLELYFIQAGHDIQAVRQAINMSGGLPGLTALLLESDTLHPVRLAFDQARVVLRATSFERLALVDTLLKDKQIRPVAVIDATAHLAAAALRHVSVSAGDEAEQRMAHWARIVRVCDDAQTAINQGTQPKLALTHLMLAL